MDLFNNLIKFKNSKEWIDFEKYYGKESILEQIDFFRFEDANTNFLASLLKENNPYNLGDYPLQLFCELIAVKDVNKKFEHIKNICLSDGDLSNIDIKTQVVLPSGRIDLVIKFDFAENGKEEHYLIALEAKLCSFERPKQCEDYRKDIEKLEEYKSYKKAYIYLSLSDEEISDEENYLKIKYQDLVDYVYEPCSYKTENNNLSLLLSEYINGFSRLYSEGKIPSNFDVNNIPITNEGKILTQVIWNKNKETIKEFIKNISIKNTSKKYISEEAQAFFKKNQTLLKILFINLTKINNLNVEAEYKNTIDNIERIAKNIKCRNKLNDKYYSDCEFIYQLFKDIITKANITEYKQLDKVNEHKFIYSPEEYTNAKTQSYHTINQYGTISIPENSENNYFYSINNTPTEILNLIEVIKDNFPEYYNSNNLNRLEDIKDLLK